MPTERSATQLVFEGFAKRQVVGCFDGGAVTSNGGGALLREADRGIGLTRRVARCFRDERDPDLVVHRLETLVAQRVHAVALGYEDIDDHDELRHDPVLGLLSDTLEPKRADVATLAGKSTLNRLEHGLKSGAGRYHKISVIDAAWRSRESAGIHARLDGQQQMATWTGSRPSSARSLSLATGAGMTPVRR